MNSIAAIEAKIIRESNVEPDAFRRATKDLVTTLAQVEVDGIRLGSLTMSNFVNASYHASVACRKLHNWLRGGAVETVASKNPHVLKIAETALDAMRDSFDDVDGCDVPRLASLALHKIASGAATQ